MEPGPYWREGGGANPTYQVVISQNTHAKGAGKGSTSRRALQVADLYLKALYQRYITVMPRFDVLVLSIATLGPRGSLMFRSNLEVGRVPV